MNIFKSLKLWDHLPTAGELRGALDPGTDPVIKKLPPDGNILLSFLKVFGLRTFYNGREKHIYRTELLYYVNKDNQIVTSDLEIDIKDLILE